MKIFISLLFLASLLTTPAAPTATNAAPPQPLVLIRPASQSPLPESWTTLKHLSLTNTTLESAILRIFNAHRARLVLETNLPAALYDFYFAFPVQRDSATEVSFRDVETIFTQALRANFSLAVQRETRERDILVLKAGATTAEKLAHSTSNGKAELFSYNSIIGINRSVADLAAGLENAAGVPILDATGLTNLYSYHLEWRQRDFQRPNRYGITAAIEQLGLQLMPEKHPVEFIVVRSAAK